MPERKKIRRRSKELPPWSVTVSGYKSIAKETTIELRGLSVLAGANSSGKSSIMQPLLLLKQTLEASYDPGAILLDGPNLTFTSASQLLSRVPGQKVATSFEVGLKVGNAGFRASFRHGAKGFSAQKVTYLDDRRSVTVHPGMRHADIMHSLGPSARELLKEISDERPRRKPKYLRPKIEWAVVRDRCLLQPVLVMKSREVGNRLNLTLPDITLPTGYLKSKIRGIIHLPGLRGIPARTYPVTAVEDAFPGTFETYAASVIAQWQRTSATSKLAGLNRDLQDLGLTWRVWAEPIQETQVEIRVGRLEHPTKRASDLVSLADVGLGTSQTLPVAVALRVASSGQLVYLEQPEIHLHPRAQVQLAKIILTAVKRGVRVVVETHSSLLLLALQTLVAEGHLRANDVLFHWFSRRPDGVTEVRSARLGSDGSFGDWPEDFGDVRLYAEKRYLDAAQSKVFRNK